MTLSDAASSLTQKLKLSVVAAPRTIRVIRQKIRKRVVNTFNIFMKGERNDSWSGDDSSVENVFFGFLSQFLTMPFPQGTNGKKK